MLTPIRLSMFALVAVAIASTGSNAEAQAIQGIRETASNATKPFANTVEVGSKAPTVELDNLEGRTVNLADTFKAGDTVLVVLRGYPGYQCGICSRQATGFLSAADKFAAADKNLIMVYPGPADGLEEHAEEFLEGKRIPAGVTMLLDPDYKLVDAYGLRWDAPNETAYPSTFVIEEGGKVTWARVSKSHGGRASAKEVLAVVTK